MQAFILSTFKRHSNFLEGSPKNNKYLDSTLALSVALAILKGYKYDKAGTENQGGLSSKEATLYYKLDVDAPATDGRRSQAHQSHRIIDAWQRLFADTFTSVTNTMI